MKHIFRLKNTKILLFLGIVHLLLIGCNGKLPGGDARKFPADPAERVKKNLEEGRGLKLNDAFNNQRGGVFEFASSNELWRATLDIIDFIPLASANYSGGIIITDWYSEDQNEESIKITIRFLSNEIRSDALNIKVFNKKCIDNLLSCKITEQDGILVKELKREILKKATLYKEEDKKKKE